MSDSNIQNLNKGIQGLNSCQRTFQDLARQSEAGYNPQNMGQLQAATRKATDELMNQLFLLGTEMNAIMQAQGESIKSLTSNLNSIQTWSEIEHCTAGMSALESMTAPQDSYQRTNQKTVPIPDDLITKLPPQNHPENFSIHKEATPASLAKMSVADSQIIFPQAQRPTKSKIVDSK